MLAADSVACAVSKLWGGNGGRGRYDRGGVYGPKVLWRLSNDLQHDTVRCRRRIAQSNEVTLLSDQDQEHVTHTHRTATSDGCSKRQAFHNQLQNETGHSTGRDALVVAQEHKRRLTTLPSRSNSRHAAMDCACTDTISRRGVRGTAEPRLLPVPLAVLPACCPVLRSSPSFPPTPEPSSSPSPSPASSPRMSLMLVEPLRGRRKLGCRV